MKLIMIIACILLFLFTVFVIPMIAFTISGWIRNIQYNKLRRQCKEQQIKEREQK